MANLTTEVLPVLIDKASQSLRHAVRRKYLRKRLKRLGNYKKALTPEQRKQAKTFWKQYTKHYSPLWHELFAAKTGSFDVRYVPVDIMFTEIEGKLNDWSSAHGIDNKNNYAMYFPEVKQPKSVFRKMSGLYHDNDYHIITEEQAMQNCIDCGDVIFKVALESGKGGGIGYWRTQDGVEKLKEAFRGFEGDINAQEFITQHAGLSAINAASVNTIRIITYASKTGIRRIAAYLQVGRGSARQDQVAKGGADVSIRPDGTLCKYAIDNDYNRSTQHPCGLTYEGFKVPGYENVCQTAMKLHEKLGNFRIVSWDFAVGENEEPIFIEVNLKYGGIMFHQMSGGPLFGDDTETILKEVYGK